MKVKYVDKMSVTRSKPYQKRNREEEKKVAYLWSHPLAALLQLTMLLPLANHSRSTRHPSLSRLLDLHIFFPVVFLLVTPSSHDRP